MKFTSYKTAKGSELPLLDLRGKAYMQVAHRLVWFTEDVPSYTTKTEFLVLTENETVARVTVEILNENNRIVKSVSATKREDKKGFADHTEKAETGALGRALAILGYGTQFAIADLEENNRLADSPVVIPSEKQTTTNVTLAQVKEAAPKAVDVKSETTGQQLSQTPAPKPFRKRPTTNTQEDAF